MCYRSHCLLCNGGNSTLLPVWEVFQPLWKPQVSCTTDQTKKPWGALLTYIKTFTPLKIAVFLYISDQTCQVCLIILMFSALHFEVTLLWIISGNTVFRVEKASCIFYLFFIFFIFVLKGDLPFFALSVFLQRVEKIPSVQSLVATSSRPNIWGAVIALGFIRISLWGWPQSRHIFLQSKSQINYTSIMK